MDCIVTIVECVVRTKEVRIIGVATVAEAKRKVKDSVTRHRRERKGWKVQDELVKYDALKLPKRC